MQEFEGKLYASMSSRGVYSFDGNVWRLSYSQPSGSTVESLGAFNGSLYAGLYPSGKVMVFDNSSWAESFDSNESSVLSFAGFGGSLYAGTYPSGKVLRLNNSGWGEVFATGGMGVNAMAVLGGRLYSNVFSSGWGGNRVYDFDGEYWNPVGVLALSSHRRDGVAVVREGDAYFASSSNASIVSYSNSWRVLSSAPNASGLAGVNGSLYALSNGTFFKLNNSGWNELYSLNSTLWTVAGFSDKLYAGGFGKLYSCDTEA